MLQEGHRRGDAGVDRHLVLPLKLGPHRTERGVGAGRRHDVVHDVDVDVGQHDDAAPAPQGVTPRCPPCAAACALVHQVAKDGARLGGGDLDVSADALQAGGWGFMVRMGCSAEMYSKARQLFFSARHAAQAPPQGALPSPHRRRHRPSPAPHLLRAGRQRVRLRPLHELQVAHGGQLQGDALHRVGGAVDDRHIEHDVVLVHCSSRRTRGGGIAGGQQGAGGRGRWGAGQ